MFNEVKVLIVEDDQAVADLLEAALDRYDFDTTLVSTLAHGMAAADEADIMVLDLVLRNGQSQPLLRQWTHHDPYRPAMVFSAFIQDEKALYRSGAWNVFQKPGDIDIITDAVCRYAQIVLAFKRAACSAEQVKRLTKIVYGLALAVAALGGIELVPMIIKAIGAIL